MLTPDQIREHATTLMRDHARDVPSLTIGESLEDVLGDADVETYDAVCGQIKQLIRAATITVEFPAEGESA